MTVTAARGNRPSGSAAWILGAVLALFFISGACGLVYEIIWTRLLRLVMGNTVFSITTVLCAFMGGLAAGSYLGGRFIERRNDPLRVYAVLEAAVGVYCLLLPQIIHVAEPLYRIIYRDYHNVYLLFALTRFVFCGLILLVPATFMGATLPVLSRFVARSADRIGRQIGRLYAINTFGAVLGAAGAGFVLIPALGMTGTIRLACAANLVVAAAAYLLHRRCHLAPPGGEGTPPPSSQRPAGEPVRPGAGSARVRLAGWVLLVGYGMSGMAALSYEVAWSRALSLAVSSSVYAFSLMLTAFILGLAIGSMALSRFADRWRDAAAVLGVTELAIGITALAISPAFGWLPLHLGGVVIEMGRAFWKLQLTEFGVLLAVMLVPTTLMGMAFPLAARAYAAVRGGVSRPVGSIYAANTLGSIAGAFLAGFVLIPAIGMRGTILAAVVVNTAVGVGLLAAAVKRRRLWHGVVGVAAVVGVLVGGRMMSGWDPSLLTFGPYWQAQLDVPWARGPSVRQIEQAARSSEVIYHKEGAFDTITIRRMGTNRALCINGKPDASSGPDMRTQLLLGHLPMLLHGRAERVLVIGLASGVTLGATSLYPAGELDCVDISPDMPEATHFFDDINHNVLADPRVKLFIADGRNHLALTDRKYDVIISEPSNPWIAGIADLFTREFFQLARQRLNEGGLVGIWVQGYGIEPRAFYSITKALAEVFPCVTIWELDQTDTMLIASERPLRIDLGWIEEAFAKESIRKDLAVARVGSPRDLLAQFVTDGGGLAGAMVGVPVHTDDNALVEFSTPRTMFNKQVVIYLLAALNQYRGTGLERVLSGEGVAGGGEAWEQEIAQIARMIQARKVFTEGIIYASQKQEGAAYEAYRRAREMDPNCPMFQTLKAEMSRDAAALAAGGKMQQAMMVLEHGVNVFSDDAEMHLLYARGAYAVGQLPLAIKHYDLALEIRPNWPEAANDLAWILATAQDPVLRDGAKALRLAEQADQADRTANTLDTLAAAQAETGKFDQAVATARQAAELARASKQMDMVWSIEARIATYQAGKPVRDK